MNIEKYLILNRYLLSLFGVKEFRSLQEHLKNVKTGEDSDGRSNFVNVLRSFDDLKIEENKLLIYDENIKSYVKKINFRREPVILKYFQYLAILFTEIVLDNLKNNKNNFLYNLNKFLKSYKREQDINIIDQFTEDDLKKLAFWMATGSGKTLIMHINYYQFFNYNLFSPDNIILITPNEGLSKQHFEELQKSGIPSKLYSGSLNGGLKLGNEVLVIEMTKFVEEKKGGGVTIPVDVFEGKNLIFVDEGHKGKKSEEQKWAKLRNRLAEKGFVFEYSATFGQILSVSQEEILKEYAKSIIYDYSYKYFYLDGYGKDFSVLNIERNKLNKDEFSELMFVANLLSFYEQLLVFEENKQLCKEYNIEKPLWIFVGTTVTGKEEESDVIQIVDFINKVIQDKDWLEKNIKKLINGNTGLINQNGNDLFKEKFSYLREKGLNVPFIINDIYVKVFGGKGSLGLYELKNAEGEIGLKIGENEYFGVINIGNVSGFKKQLERKNYTVNQDVISSSIFDDIKKENSKTNLLIGSKKFIEGWDTWRVSTMGLINIGKGQGPQIIQLFGRGVRLKGKGMSLKRSGDNNNIKYLEVLNIYGMSADYLEKFLEAINREEVEFETIEIPVQIQHKNEWKNLYTISKPQVKFEEKTPLKIKQNTKINFNIDFRPKVSLLQSARQQNAGIVQQQLTPNVANHKFNNNLIKLLDFNRLWQDLIEFKVQRNYWNLIFSIEDIKDLLISGNYSISASQDVFQVRNKEDIERIEELALAVIKKYFDLFYRKEASKFETQHVTYEKVEQLKLPFISESKPKYTIQINKENKELIKKIKNLVKNFKVLLKDDNYNLPRIHFDNSLYVPLLIKTDKIEKITPDGLVESEIKFLEDLRNYLKSNKSKNKQKIYILRNYPFTGIGFQLEWSKFYPDFIMWIKGDKKQTIVFIDPKGLQHTKGLDDEKIKFATDKNFGIKKIEEQIKNNKKNKLNIILESFILSSTPYTKLIKGMYNPPKQDEYFANHVLFLEDVNWPKKLFDYL